MHYSNANVKSPVRLLCLQINVFKAGGFHTFHDWWFGEHLPVTDSSL